MRYSLLILLLFLSGAVFIGVAGWRSIAILEKSLVNTIVSKSLRNVSSALVGAFWERYAMVFRMVEEDKNFISKVPQYTRFVNDLHNFFLPMGFEQVSLFTRTGVLFFQLYGDHPRFDPIKRLADYGNYILYKGSKKGEIIAVIDVDDNDSEDSAFFKLEVVYDLSYIAQWINNLYAVASGCLGLALIGILFLWYRALSRFDKELKQQYDINFKLKSAKSLAEQSTMNKSKFLANVSHELRTPLNSIIGFSQMIRKDALSQEKYAEYALNIHTSAVHLLSLIEDILDLSKSEANKLEIHNDWFDLIRVIETVYRMMLPKAQEVNVELIKDLSVTSLTMRSDQKRMKQVFLNLLSNAVKFTPSGGRVSISVEIVNKSVIIKVVDTGIGIAPGDIAKAMGTFGQIESYLSRKHSGTGLGLPLTRNLVHLMNGQFKLNSELYKGTEVILKFPYAPMTEEEAKEFS